MSLKTITITVTSEDIANGKRRYFTACPIALACKRAGLKRIRVLDYAIRYGFSGIEGLKPKVKAFVHKFDEGEPVKPFSFCLHV